jgi:cyclic dehypoxanthinyl futalosine synthase
MELQRLSPEKALDLYRHGTQLDLMIRADALRQEIHPGQDVTFVVDTNPNYTNVCTTDCTFCSFYRKPGHHEAYVRTPEEIGRNAALAQAQGATTVLLQGGHNPDLGLSYYLDTVEALQHYAPGMHLHLFSPSEILHLAEHSDLDARAVLQKLWDAGLRTMPGGGAEILVDSVRRKVSPKKTRSDAWLGLMGAAHRIGFKTSATMTYGHLEKDEDIIEHLLRIRDLQDKTGGFYAFIPWSFKPGSSPLSRLVTEAVPASRYVRVIALARLFLDNVPHIQASWFGEGWRAGQLALHAGADDFGGLLLEENVLNQARHQVSTKLNSVLNMIRDAGYTPVQRTTTYNRLERYETVPEFEGAFTETRTTLAAGSMESAAV